MENRGNQKTSNKEINHERHEKHEKLTCPFRDFRAFRGKKDL